MKIRIAIVGGHLTPALSVIGKLQKRNKYQIFYIGRKYPLEGDEAYSLEHLVIKRLGIPFYSLVSARLQRSFTIYTLLSILKFPLSILQSLYLLLKIKPALVLSFGGYVSLPICLWAYFLRIPIIIHEQTHILGLSNRLIARIASSVCLSWKDTRYAPKSSKVVITANPTLFEQSFKTKDTSLTKFGDNKLPLIYITGGSLGSNFINKLTGEILETITGRFRLLHQTGSADKERDFLLLSQKRKALPPYNQENYQLVKHVDPFEVIAVLKKVSFIVGRAGANTVFEMQNAAVPGILIPLPWAADNEQEENAQRLVKLGLAIMIRQEKLNAQLLLATVNGLWKDFASYKENARLARKNLPQNASDKIVQLIESYFERNSR